jgi:hypothetical protein
MVVLVLVETGLDSPGGDPSPVNDIMDEILKETN